MVHCSHYRVRLSLRLSLHDRLFTCFYEHSKTVMLAGRLVVGNSSLQTRLQCKKFLQFILLQRLIQLLCNGVTFLSGRFKCRVLFACLRLPPTVQRSYCDVKTQVLVRRFSACSSPILPARTERHPRRDVLRLSTFAFLCSITNPSDMDHESEPTT